MSAVSAQPLTAVLESRHTQDTAAAQPIEYFEDVLQSRPRVLCCLIEA